MSAEIISLEMRRAPRPTVSDAAIAVCAEGCRGALHELMHGNRDRAIEILATTADLLRVDEQGI